MEANATYNRLIALLEHESANFRLIDHAPEGRTDIVSGMRGHAVNEAAKCIILLVKVGKKVTKYVLAVVPGDARVDMDAIRRLMRATFLRFAEPEIAERLARSVPGTVLPFAFDPTLELIVDPEVAESETMYFNAARLDQSLALSTQDYLRIAKPRIVPIATR